LLVFSGVYQADEYRSRAAICTAVPIDPSTEFGGPGVFILSLMLACRVESKLLLRGRGADPPCDWATRKETHCMGALSAAATPHRRTETEGR